MSILRHFGRLKSRRSDLETKLVLYEARSCFGNDEIDDGTLAELRGRLSEVSDEMSSLGRSRR
jgi:hypothetical protein